MKRVGRVLVVWSALAVACCGRNEGAAGSSKPLPSGAVATVGDDVIDVALVGRVAAAQSVAPDIAASRIVSDALLAAAGRRHLVAARIAVIERRSFARAALEAMSHEARSAGAPTDDEIRQATARRWWELDRPPMIRTAHAVVLVKSPADDARARALARRIADAVASAADPGQFRAIAESVKEPGLETRVESLDPVTADGRAMNVDSAPPPGSQAATYDPAYVEAAFKLTAVGQKTGVVRSSFGYHVIVATAFVPEQRVSLTERRALLEPEIIKGRATRLRETALERGRAAEPVEVERAAPELTEKVNLSL
jgi:hypothetical protein